MKYRQSLFILFFAFSIFGVAQESLVISKIDEVLPEGMSVQSIKESQVPGLYVVDIGDLQPIYASKDGNFFLYGELYAIQGNSLLNTTKQEINLNRRAILDSAISEEDFITFTAEDERYVVTVFTDVDCG